MKYTYNQAVKLLKSGKTIRQVGMPAHFVIRMNDDGNAVLYNTKTDTSGFWAVGPADKEYARYQIV